MLLHVKMHELLYELKKLKVLQKQQNITLPTFIKRFEQSWYRTYCDIIRHYFKFFGVVALFIFQQKKALKML